MATTPTTAQIVQQMRDALGITIPDLDTGVGTPLRKVLDVVGEVGAEGHADRYLLTYQYDIDAKQGPDLDDWAQLFGQQRHVARRATGAVTFERTTVAPEPIPIAIGTQVATSTSPVVLAQTVVPAVLDAGETSIDVPVQVIIGGSAGNVGPNTLIRRVSQISAGISSISNVAALSGGADAESDSAFRARLRRTIFRGFAGTEDMFLGVALDDPDVTQANVIGASKRYREQIEIVSGTAVSSVPNAKYIYPTNVFFGENIDGGDLVTPGIDYSFNDGVIPPTVTSLNGTTVPDGIYDLEFAYLPNASRNDPTSGITNRVDVYVNGTRAMESMQIAIFKTANVFNTTTGSWLHRTNYTRLNGSNPTTGNYFIPLVFAPVIDLAGSTLVINSVTYTEGTHYWLVTDITVDGGTPTSYSGIEFRSAANGNVLAIPANNQQFTPSYISNAIPRDLEVAYRLWRLATTDVKVHVAQPIYLNVYLAVILMPGYSSAGVQPALQARLGDLMSSIGFVQSVQVSDLLSVAHQVPGVDAVRFLTNADDAVHYAIQQMAPDGTTLLSTFDNGGTPRRAVDVPIDDDSIPVLNNVVIVVKAANTFGAV